MSKAKLVFLMNDAGEMEGLADAGIETFRDAPYASSAREAGQNARDAVDRLPVRMTFNLRSIGQSDFPAHSDLVQSITACAATVEDEKEKEFFENALNVATKDEIAFLEIADFNTKGLAGPADKLGTPFHSLLKATGVSTKDSDTSGGSFGIGKNASFAVSDLQLVMYSTMYADEEGEVAVAAQGKAKLVSHVDSQNNKRRAIGYWGDPDGFKAITDATAIPPWMRRDKKGTSIFCMGFRASADWAEHITSSLVMNFFFAIHTGEMTFEVDNGKFKINQNTLEELLARKEIRLAAERSGHLPDLKFATDLHRCLISPNATERFLEVDGLGAIRIRVLAEVGLPRRVGFVRNGMLITDNLRHFGQPLARFPGCRDFVALLNPANEEAGRLLKRLENPAHNNFSAQRIADPARRAAADKAIRVLGKELRELIKSSTGVQQDESVILDELAHFFADQGRADARSDPDAQRDPETYLFVPPVVAPRRKTRRVQTGGTEGGNSGTGTGSGGGGNGSGTGSGRGTGTGGTGQQSVRHAVQLHEIRNLIRRDSNGDAVTRLLHFDSEIDGSVRLTIQATGLNASEVLRLHSSDRGRIETDELILEVRAGVRSTVSVTFAQPYDGPIEVTGHMEVETEVGHANN